MVTAKKPVAKPTMPTFTGKYATIRKDFWKGTVGSKFDPQWSEQKTETAYRNAKIKEFKQAMTKIDQIENAGTVLDGHVSIRWTKGGAYGKQAIATLSYTYLTPDGRVLSKVVEGKRTTGMGYDKESTAFSNAAEKSPEFMKILLDARAKKKDLGFGVSSTSGKPYFPYFGRGVGMGSIWRSMEKAGYNFDNVRTWNDDLNIYQFSIKRKPTRRQ